MNIHDIVKAKLLELGADGLIDEYECACGIEDLAPCGEFPTGCVPAKRERDPDKIPSGYDDWYVPLEDDLRDTERIAA